MGSEVLIIPKINVGNMIINYLRAIDRPQAFLAKNMNMASTNLSRLLKKSSMETDRLFEICLALEHNFFAVFGKDPDLEDDNYTIGMPELGLHIERRLRDLKMSQMDFATRIGIGRSDVNRILKKTSFDTDKLIAISEALNYNFFKDFYNSYPDNEEKMKDRHQSDVLQRLEELAIENDRLKSQLESSNNEIARLKKVILDAGLSIL
jgi:transcriptional regulator with XRE-family HTH domain